jgi:nicotinate-nucleotide--dimethylbenzimidazole phosphoribosyltransferase
MTSQRDQDPEISAARPMITTILFDVGTLSPTAPFGRVAGLVPQVGADAVRSLRALAPRYRLGAVTTTADASGDDLRHTLRASGLDELLDAIVAVDLRTPEPRTLRQALSALDIDPGAVLLVGAESSAADVAETAGMRFVASTPGRDPGEAVRDALTVDVGAYAAATALLGPVDEDAAAEARARQDRLTKPPGSLGRLEALSVQLAAITGQVPPSVPRPAAIAVFAADHGAVAEGVSAWPAEVTGQMVANFASGGAAINVLARAVGASVTVVDVGVASDLDALGLAEATSMLRRRIRPGTSNLATGPAMTGDEVRRALDVGAQVATELVRSGARALVTGDMGIGNTTAAAAVVAALTGRSAAEVTGPGAGADAAMMRRKVSVIERALTRVPLGSDARPVLAEVGGLEIAAIAGFIVAGASHRIPVVVDGVVSGAALLAAATDRASVLPYVVAGHRSTEPGATALLDHLGLAPVLDLGLRLGEGTGACLALPVLEAAALILRDMATFDTAGVSER